MKSQDCTEQLEALSEQLPAKMLPQAERIEVTAVRIEEAGGFVLYRDAAGTKSAFPVLQEDSAWKVAALVGSSRQSPVARNRYARIRISRTHT